MSKTMDKIQNEILQRRMELRKKQLDNIELDRLQRSKLPRKTKQWVLDKMGFDADYSPYDAEGRPEPDPRDAL